MNQATYSTVVFRDGRLNKTLGRLSTEDMDNWNLDLVKDYLAENPEATVTAYVETDDGFLIPVSEYGNG